MRNFLFNWRLAGVVATVALLVAGRGRPNATVDKNWTEPVAISASIGALGGWIDLHRCQSTIIGIGEHHGGSPFGVVLSQDGKSWSPLFFPAIPNGYIWEAVSIDPQTQNVLSVEGWSENDQRVVMKAFFGTVDGSKVKSINEATWFTGKDALLGKTASNVILNYPGKREGIGLDQGIINGPEMIIPYSFGARTVSSNGNSRIYSHGPFNQGVFRSSDFGRSWNIESISAVSIDAVFPMCKTAGYYYYFAGDNPFWSSRKADGGEWEAPETIAKTFALYVGWSAEVGEGDTVHVCWMDRRHNKWRFNIDGPPVENDDIYYCHRKDADSKWGRQVLLSTGLEYCYPPSISAEGQDVVVVWAATPSAGKDHSEYDPNDIFYVLSKDGGDTWTKPVKVTDKAKEGVVSGRPKVVLLKGMIHLLYTQGKMESGEVAPGVVKLGQPPWPIFYTQRPFPN